MQRQLVEPFPVLDVYTEDGVTEVQPGRIESLATISAGTRRPGQNGKPGLPQASRDGTIYVHGAADAAPGLRRILQENGNKRLTIAFPSDNMADFIQQRFARYSASKLEIYGDARGVTVLHGEQRITHQAGTPEYRAAIKQCKVTVAIYFHLAEWTADGPQIIFPDGLGLYRLRFTSRNSLHSIVSYLQTLTTNYTSGRIAGMPFELSLDYRDVPDNKSERRIVPVWQIVFKPPQDIRFTTQNYRSLISRSIEQGEVLNLALPEPETIEAALYEEPEHDLDEQDLDAAAITAIETPGATTCDAPHWTKVYFAIVDGTWLQTDKGRDYIMRRYSGDTYDGSLAGFLADATEEDAEGLMSFVREQVETRFGPLAQYERQAREAMKRGVKTAKGEPWPALDHRAKPEVIQKALSLINAALYEAEAAQQAKPATSAETPLHGAMESAQQFRDELRDDDDDSDPFAYLDDDYTPGAEQPALIDASTTTNTAHR